jgi:hypothetical protein
MELDDALADLVVRSGARLLRVGYQLTHDRRAAQDQRGPSRLRYRLIFSYQKGLPVVVDVMKGCYPEIDNLSLQSGSANSILPIISGLVHPG